MAESVIKIDESLQVTEEIASLLLFIIGENLTNFLPRLGIFKILAAKARPGLNSQITSASAVSRFKEVGIPTGTLEDGTPNVMEAYTEMMIEVIFDAIQSDMRVDIAVDPGIVVQASGANAGGPVVAIGATTAPGTAVGIGQ